MNEWILDNVLEGPPWVYYTPAGWLTLEQWYQYVLREVRDVAESEWRAHLGFKQGRAIFCCEGEPPGAE